MKKIVCAILPTLLIAFVLGGVSGSAAAQDNTTYVVNYYSNANTSGAPDATLRVINDGDTGGTLCAAFGDNAFDVAMLSEARVPVAVRPKDRLRERAAEVAGLVEIAPE